MINGCFRGHRGVHTKKTKTTKMDLTPTKKYTKSYKKFETPVRFKNPQGNGTRG